MAKKKRVLGQVHATKSISGWSGFKEKIDAEQADSAARDAARKTHLEAIDAARKQTSKK